MPTCPDHLFSCSLQEEKDLLATNTLSTCRFLTAQRRSCKTNSQRDRDHACGIHPRTGDAITMQVLDDHRDTAFIEKHHLMMVSQMNRCFLTSDWGLDQCCGSSETNSVELRLRDRGRILHLCSLLHAVLDMISPVRAVVTLLLFLLPAFGSGDATIEKIDRTVSLTSHASM
jgi:hypothetical protein